MRGRRQEGELAGSSGPLRVFVLKHCYGTRRFLQAGMSRRAPIQQPERRRYHTTDRQAMPARPLAMGDSASVQTNSGAIWSQRVPLRLAAVRSKLTKELLDIFDGLLGTWQITARWDAVYA